METPEQYTVLTLSKNVHPNTDGSPWGWIILDGSKIRFATWSGHEEKQRCEELVRVYNQAKELIKENERLRGTIGVECVKQLLAAREEIKNLQAVIDTNAKHEAAYQEASDSEIADLKQALRTNSETSRIYRGKAEEYIMLYRKTLTDCTHEIRLLRGCFQKGLPIYSAISDLIDINESVLSKCEPKKDETTSSGL